MYIIREETFNLLGEYFRRGHDPATLGKLVPSKLTNCLVWQANRMPNSVEDMIIGLGCTGNPWEHLFGPSGASPMSDGQQSPSDGSDVESCYSLFSSASSEHDHQLMKIIWDEMAAISTEEDECEFCSIEPTERHYYSQHPLYLNGKVHCPVLASRVYAGSSFTMKRHERAALVFPRGSSMGYLLAIAIPLLVPGRNIYLSHNFEANYGVPSNETQYFLWYQRFKDSKFNITKAIETNRRRRSAGVQTGLSRTYFYDQLEERMELYGYNATGCMERLICEMSELPLHEHNGVFGDVLSVILRPSASLREPLPGSYYEAESRGSIEGCHRYRAFCGTDLLGLVSTILFALAVPLDIPSRNIFMSYNFEGNYNSPADANIFTEGFANYIKGIVEPLTAPSRPVESFGIRKRSAREGLTTRAPNTPQITRRQIYRMLQNHLQRQHYQGKKCLQRMICEAALHPFSEANGVVGDVVQLLLSPSTSKDESLPEEYFIAEQAGQYGSCDRYRQDCPQDPLAINATTDSRDASREEGRLLVRGKPVLVYPETAPTRHQLISGIGVPVQGISRSVVFGWVLKAQYYLPSKPENYEPINLENWNESRRALPDRTRRSIERYEVDNVRIRVEPLPVQEMPSNAVEEEDDDYYYEENETEGDREPGRGQDGGKDHAESKEQGTVPDDYDVSKGRWMVYKALEGLSSGYGFGGRACVLRSICEAAEIQFTHTGGVFAELLHIMFSPSTTKESVSEHLDNEYYRAEQLGRSGAPCAKLFRECSTSLLDMFSGVHDLHPLSYFLGVLLLPLTTADFIPWLIVPETAPTRHQLISGIGIPVGTPESITSGWVIKAQYFLPTKVDDLKPQLWENWNDSRRAVARRDLSGVMGDVPLTKLPIARGHERYVVDSVPAREEPLDTAGEQEDDFDDGDDSYWKDAEDEQILHSSEDGALWPAAKEIDPAQLDGYSTEQSRWTTYRAMERLSESYGLPGRACVLRSVCESAAAPFTHTGGIFAELLHIVFAPSSTEEPLSEHRDNEYFRAEQLGRSGAPCERLFSECAHSLLDIFTGVHDPDTNTMRLLHDEVRAFLMRK
uniref:Uncharacterized protein n=1 Tax=Anopheles epiroticus TaxID=199890 RepID=A0A182P8X9_9DIPT